MDTLYKGYVDMIDGSGIKTVEIYDDKGYIYAFVDGDMADDVDTAEQFADSYGENLYDSLKDYRAEEGARYIFDFWPEDYKQPSP